MKNYTRKFILGWILNAAIIYAISYFIDFTDFTYDSGWTLAFVSLAFTIISFIIKPVVKILSLPLFFVGSFLSLIVNAAILVAIDYYVAGFSTGGILMAMIAGAVIGLMSFIAHLII